MVDTTVWNPQANLARRIHLTTTRPRVINALSVMDEEDPWLWDINRVVKELCTEGRTWPPFLPEQRLPDARQLEINLRKFGINGWGLLMAVDNETLRDEFGLVGPRSIKHRATILHGLQAPCPLTRPKNTTFRLQIRPVTTRQYGETGVLLAKDGRDIQREQGDG
jgi:hypothetical protein